MVLIVDFGSQYTELLALQIRKNQIFSEIIEWHNPKLITEAKKYQAIIISGSPSSAKDELHEEIFKEILKIQKPKLCICYGMQVIHKILGGTVVYGQCPEFGNKKVNICQHNEIVDGIPITFQTWMSHNDSVTKLAPGFLSIAKTDSCHSIAIHPQKQIYTLQFHPEVEHCYRGDRIIRNFLFLICKIQKNWQIENLIEKKVEQIQQTVKNETVYLGLSGGIDSVVVAKLLQKSSVNCKFIFVDNGLIFQPAASKILDFLQQEFKDKFIVINTENKFLNALKGIVDPEQKRNIIGTLFVDVFKAEIEKRGGSKFLAQGTIHSDLIESGKKNTANTIKTHHNTIDDLKKSFTMLEPLTDLFKNEVRDMGKELGIPEFIVNAHPFPGPGYAIRILGEVTKEKIEILKKVDAILIQELINRNLYSQISQCFSVITHCKTTGVSGDNRTYGHVIAIRAIDSKNMMTAMPSRIQIDVLIDIGSAITNQIPEVTRVVYDLTSKPPATIEWE